MNKKYEFTGKTKQYNGVTLKQIIAVRDFGNIKAGVIGGWLESEENLSHEDNAWVWGDAWVWGNAKVWGYAEVYGNARVCGNAKVCGNAEVFSANHTLVIGPVGSRDDFTTFYRDKDNEITVRCGCFNGKIDKFLEKVLQTHGDNHHALVYKTSAELAKVSIDLDSEAPKESEG